MTQPPTSSPHGPEPWAGAREQWEGPVARVRAGHRLSHAQWPDAARVAVALSFDVDQETPWLRDGDLSPGGLAHGEFGSRCGLPRILDLLDRHSIPASFFVPAVAAQLHPSDLADIGAAGHEIGAHGWIHERPDTLTPAMERDLLHRSLDLLESLTGSRPVGNRTPSFDTSPMSLHLAHEAGLSYDSSLMADDMPYEILLDDTASGLFEVPTDWTRDDAAFLVTDRFGGLRPIPDPRLVTAAWLEDFRAAHEEGGLFQLTLHPDLIGRRGSFRAFAELVAQIVASPGVWFATHAQVAALARARSTQP